MEPTRPRVLVIDPDPAIRALLMAVTRRLGFDSDTAGNREEALACAHTAVYAIITLEPRMPGGYTLLHELPTENVIVLTTSSDLSSCEGAAAVLRKPFL